MLGTDRLLPTAQGRDDGPSPRSRLVDLDSSKKKTMGSKTYWGKFAHRIQKLQQCSEAQQAGPCACSGSERPGEPAKWQWCRAPVWLPAKGFKRPFACCHQYRKKRRRNLGAIEGRRLAPCWVWYQSIRISLVIMTSQPWPQV